MDMIQKARRRFMTLMMLLTASTIVAALVAIYWLTYSSQESINRQRLNSFEEIKITGSGVVSYDGSNAADAYVVERTSPDIGVYFSLLVDQQGQIISSFGTDDSQTQELFQAAADIAWQGENYSKVELEGRLWQYSVSPAVASLTVNDEQQLQRSNETYQIRFVDITESHMTLKTLSITLCIIGILLLVFFFFFSLFFSKRAISPLIEVMEKQQQFVADASHELKTPVSIIKANCSVLYANEEDTIASQIGWLDNIKTGADRMTKLIQSLMILVKIEGSDNEIVKTLVSLEKETDDALVMLDLMIKEKSLFVETSYCSKMIWSDPDSVRQVLDIVLDNAIKYSNPGGKIRVSITQEKKWLCLSVFNTGDRIDKVDIKRIFDRFYRAEDARTADGSHGLGLSIAQAVMRQLGGTITAESNDQGAMFTLRFPHENKGSI